MASWKRQAELGRPRKQVTVSYSICPTQPAAPGYCWVRIKGGPRDGEWVQVLRREYERK